MATKLDLSSISTALSSIISAVPPLGPGPRGHLLKAIAALKAELRRGLRSLEKLERKLKKRTR